MHVIVSVIVLGVGVFFASPYLWKYYVTPHGALALAVSRCEIDADKLLALDATKWTEEHHTDTFNPYRRQRYAYIESCVKADGWCSLGDDSIWPSSRPWASRRAIR
jgi:hypothetical protein